MGEEEVGGKGLDLGGGVGEGTIEEKEIGGFEEGGG